MRVGDTSAEPCPGGWRAGPDPRAHTLPGDHGPQRPESSTHKHLLPSWSELRHCDEAMEELPRKQSRVLRSATTLARASPRRFIQTKTRREWRRTDREP